MNKEKYRQPLPSGIVRKANFSLEKLPEDEALRAKLLMLNHLRTYLQMLEPLVLETQSRHGDAGPGVYEGLIHILHSLTNVLCIMMGKYMRGSV